MVHLDSASCSLPWGGAAPPDSLPDAVRSLIGVPDARVAFFEGATEGMAALLATWPPARVGVLPSEYYATCVTLDALDHLAVVESTADVDLVVMSHIPSQVGVINRLPEDVPLIVDIAQSAGHVDVRGLAAVAWVGTSRKWLRGPTGIGFVATSTVDVEAPEIGEDKRAGLAFAVQAFLAEEAAITARIPELGVAARRAVAELGWHVHEPLDEPTGIVTFTHQSHDPGDVHRRLFEAGIVTTLVPTTRARNMTGPVLRASFHAYNNEADIEALVGALGPGSGPTA